MFALVDLGCQTVYAIKVLLTDAETGVSTMGYACVCRRLCCVVLLICVSSPVRFYGKEDAASAPPTPAIEGGHSLSISTACSLHR